MSTLQLPACQKAGARFTKAQIADMARGSKAKISVKPKVDPIVGLIKRADAAIDRFILSSNDVYDAKNKLDNHDCGWPAVRPIDETPIFREFGHGFVFGSERHITRMFRIRKKQARQRIRDTQAQLKKATAKGWNGHGSSNFRLECEEIISSAKRTVTALLQFEEAQKAAFRKEAARLRKVQRAAGLLRARTARNSAFTSLNKLTRQIAATRPTTVQGALAVVRYVQYRQMSDRHELFSFDRGVDGKFFELLASAHKILSRADCFGRKAPHAT